MRFEFRWIAKWKIRWRQEGLTMQLWCKNSVSSFSSEKIKINKWKSVINNSASRNLKHFGNPKNENLLRKWISSRNVHKSADYWDTQFFLFSQKFHDQSFFLNCDSTEPGTTFLKICLDSAYSIDSKKGLTFENPTFNSWLISKTVFDYY